jgi:hypothetical protein
MSWAAPKARDRPYQFLTSHSDEETAMTNQFASASAQNSSSQKLPLLAPGEKMVASAFKAAAADCEAAGSIVVCHQSKVLPICRGKDVHTFKIRFILIITRAFVHNSTRINYYYYCMNIPGSTVVNFAQLWLIKMLTKLKYLGTTKIGRHTLITT